MLTSQNREKRRKQEGNWYLCIPLQTTIVYHVYTHTHATPNICKRTPVWQIVISYILLYLMDNLHACLIAYTKLTLSAGSWSSLNPVNIINNYIRVEKTFHAVSVYPSFLSLCFSCITSHHAYIVQQATRTSKNSIHFVVAFTHLDHAI